MRKHYFSEKQTSPLRLRRIEAVLRNRVFCFYAGSGVFSSRKVDLGTQLLINKAIVAPGWRILDLGCGYGAVGISIAKLFPPAKIFLTDINQRAIKLAKMNAELNNAKVTVRQGAMLSAFEGEKFNTILLNPPQAAGNEVCFAMIKASQEHLAKGGLLQIVARHNKGGKAFSTKMHEIFGNVKVTAKKSGYRIYVSEIL